ncbi:hypothetical protein D187_010348 [Cystobacter fuscus DSM 2262]|uniref:Uncharacterized protein n=1 Tax=Cystobacter fuscus (strain ATCC 25194 / DSM 2262 / NBRC 100088 / M29) TaxID=1242864 RepID=S9QKD5_CYSF2|nr:hypothetical protein D187_010348 [Cystobacter fuscus DSM 2262]
MRGDRQPDSLPRSRHNGTARYELHPNPLLFTGRRDPTQPRCGPASRGPPNGDEAHPAWRLHWP